MMTKYQIVVTKLETSVKNIVRLTEAKKRMRQSRALRKLADNVRFEKLKLANKRKLVYLHFESKVALMAAALERYTVQKNIFCKFAHWKSHVLLTKQVHLTQLKSQ